MTLQRSRAVFVSLRLAKWLDQPSRLPLLLCAALGSKFTGAVVVAFRTKRFSTQSRRSGRLRSAANSALILREFLSPASRTRGYGTTYMAAGWGLARRGLNRPCRQQPPRRAVDGL